MACSRLGQVHEIDFHLTEADIATDVILMTPARGFIDMTLETPDGAVIDQSAAQAMPGGLYYDGSNVSYYRLTLPAPIGSGAREGRWLARSSLAAGAGFGKLSAHGLKTSAATAAAFAQHGLPYSLLVHSYSNLKMVTTLSQSGFAPGATLLLRAVLTEYGVPVDHRAAAKRYSSPIPAECSARSRFPKPRPVFLNAASMRCLQGTYDMRVRARGRTLRNREFTREAVRTGAIWIGGDRPPPSSAAMVGARTRSFASCSTAPFPNG